MATQPYNDLGKLSTGGEQPLVLSNNGLNVLEINTGEFSDLINRFTDLTLDTFTTNLMGNPTPELCTGIVSWISEEPGEAPVSLGLLGGNVNVSTSGKIDLNWALSLDPANVQTTNSSGNVIYDVDYIMEYPGLTSNVASITYYLNVAYVNDTCLGNIANCNVSMPTDNVYEGTCGDSTTSTWIGIQTKASKHCGSYPGLTYTDGVNTIGNASTWAPATTTYYPYGNSTATSVIPANTTISYEFDISALGSDIYEGAIYSASRTGTLMWLSETSAGDPIITTNGCEAKKIVGPSGTQFTIKKSGNTINRDIDLDELSGTSLFINIQGYNLGNDTGDTTSTTLRIELQEVTEDNANVNYNAPLGSRRVVTPIGIASGFNTVFEFPESGEYIVASQFIDDTGAVYNQVKTINVDKTV